MLIGFIASCLFLLAGIYFIRGKGVLLLERLHAVPEDDNGTYSPSAISRFVGLIFLLFALGSLLWWLSRVFHKDLLLTFSLAVWIGTVLFVLIYLNTGERFWTPREDYLPFSTALHTAEESAAEREASKQIEAVFASVSVRGRVAYGASCLEKAADALCARTPKLEEYLDFLWSFTSVILFDEWEEQAAHFHTGSLEDFAARFGLDALENVEKPDMELLYEMQTASLKAAEENLGSSHTEFTMESTIRLIKLMWKNGLELPSVKSFRRSSAEESGGWGDPRSSEFFREPPQTEN